MNKEFLDKINQYKHIVLYRHVNPDFDAFGSQLGLYELLKVNFPEKCIYVAGEFCSDLLENYQVDYTLDLPNFETMEVLGIVLDTANTPRIDDTSYQLCKELIKIDHHIPVESYGDVMIVDSKASSTCQVITTLFMEMDENIDYNKEACNALYAGIIGDSNRFMYESTSIQTFQCATFLLEKGAVIQEVYSKLYLRKEKDIQVQKHLLNCYHGDSGLAYYKLYQSDLDLLGISREKGSSYVNLLANIEEYEIWMAITENVQDHCFRVSIRSRSISIDEIANKYNGGGHRLACGATVKNEEELQLLMNDLKEKING